MVQPLDLVGVLYRERSVLMRSKVRRQGTEGWWLILVVALISGVIGVAIATTPAWPGFIVLSAVLLGALVIYRRARLWELSPVAVLLFSYLAVALLSPVLAGAARE